MVSRPMGGTTRPPPCPRAALAWHLLPALPHACYLMVAMRAPTCCGRSCRPLQGRPRIDTMLGTRHSSGIGASVYPPLRVRSLWPRPRRSSPCLAARGGRCLSCGGAGAALAACPGGRARSRAAGRRTPGGRYIGPGIPSLIPVKKGPSGPKHYVSGRRARTVAISRHVSRYSSPLSAAWSRQGLPEKNSRRTGRKSPARQRILYCGTDRIRTCDF